MSKTKSKTLRNCGPILRGSLPFLTLKEIGELGDNGKAVMRVGYGERLVAKPDLPLSSLAVPVIDELLKVVRYKNKAAADKDLDLLRAYVGRLAFTEPA